MSDERRILEIVFPEEGFHVIGDRGIGVELFVRGVAVISGIYGVYGAIESACKCAVWWSVSIVSL